jgi:Effector Associated Constant Component 1
MADPGRTLELLVALEPEPGADAEEVERLGRQLRSELRELDVDDVRTVDGASPAPPGSKGVDAASLTELLVTLSGAGGVVATVIATVRDWLGRRSGGHKVSVTIDGDTLELDSATAAERAELIDSFVRRHQPA